MATITEFIKAEGLTVNVLPAHRNPNMANMPRNWSCDIFAPGTMAPMRVVFSQGSAHRKPPTLADVLDCLASDASSVRNARSFEDWASDLGYDSDSRKALETFQACERQADELEALLGPKAFHTLLNDVERL